MKIVALLYTTNDDLLNERDFSLVKSNQNFDFEGNKNQIFVV